MTRLLALSLALCVGCGSVGLGAAATPTAEFDPRLDFPVTRIAPAESPREAPAGEKTRLDRVSPRLFWTGLVLGVVGTAMAVGFAVDGVVTERKVQDGYADGFTREERDDLESRGDLDNALAGVGTGLGVGGFSLALIMAGVDYGRCGPISKRRKCEREATKASPR